MKKVFLKAISLVISASLLLTACSSGENVENTSDEQSTPVSESEENTEKTEETTEGSTTKEEETKEPEESEYVAQWELSGSWTQEGNFCGGYNLTITNNSGAELESWTVEFKVPDGFEFISQWNGVFEVKDGKATVTNESYNGELADGASVSFGFNYSSPEEFEPSEVTVNGKKAEEGSAETSGTPEGTSGEPEVTTTAAASSSATTTQKPPATEKPTETTTASPTPAPSPAPSDPAGTTPVSQHGQLSLKGTKIVDKNGKSYQLKGMSTHGIGWFPDFVNEQAFKTIRDDWHCNTIRLAMYSGQSEGYSGAGKAQYEALVRKGIDIAIKLDMYVIVDWHVLADQSPQVMKSDALRFFKEISSEYGNYPNIIYEICNEPNGYATWENDVKPYAEEVIPVIRANDPDSLIIVGTPTWSQDIDKALANPLKYDNVLYALHFYAATHTDWLRQRLEQCVNSGLPVFVSEFGCCDASGNGANDFGQTRKWLELLDKLGISYMNWNLANKNESSSALKPSASPNGNWKESDLSESGSWIRKWFRGEQ